MLSSDKNVETIAKLAEIVKHYLGLQGEYLKLDVIDKLVCLLKFFALTVLFFLIIMAVVLYFSFALAYWLAEYTGNVAAFFLVGMIHLLIFIFLVTFRKSLIERPLVHFLTSLFLSK